MTITEKAAYLRGFADAAKMKDDDDAVKLLKKVVEIIDDLAVCVTDLDDQVAEMSEQLDADRADLEECIYEDDDCCCDDDCDCCDDDDEDMMFELECPECGKTIYLDESIFDSDEEITCPSCGAVLEDLTIEEDGGDEE